jgi:hypothetical protein
LCQRITAAEPAVWPWLSRLRPQTLVPTVLWQAAAIDPAVAGRAKSAARSRSFFILQQVFMSSHAEPAVAPTVAFAAEAETFDGGCDCRRVRYRLQSRPLFVHACHCRWCQRESGSAFALNAMIETDRLQTLADAAELVDTPSASGQGQQIARCLHCRVALWSHYAGSGPALSFVRVGTLDEPDRLPPDIHIFTATRQPWLTLPPGVPAVPEFYDRALHWPAESLRRREALLPAIEAWQAARRR